MSLIRCKTCVMPSTRPDVPFVDGECQACINARSRPQIDWDARWKELLALLDRHDGRVIVPSSGGKDSTYIAMRLKELGCDVTAVTATTCYLTPIGRANLDNLARHVRTIEVTPNRSVRAKLCRLGMEMVGDASWPQHASIWAIPFRMAVALKTPLLMWGENSQDAYGGPQGAEQARQMTRRWCAEFGGLNGLRAADFEGVDGLTERDLQDYQLPSDAELQAAGVEGHFLGAYELWSSRRNAALAMSVGMRAELPCRANWWSFENLDCFITAWHDHGMYRKFGFGRGCVQISIDVREGRMEREAAMHWVRHFDGLFPEEYAGVKWDEALEWIGMDRVQLMAAFDKFTDQSLFAREENRRPILKEFA
jgi:N-acetyl sugar amidotransferase